MNDSVRDSKYSSDVCFHMYFITYCLSKQIRKNKFVTDGTFNSISIEVGLWSSPVEIEYVPDEHGIIVVTLPFDFKFYDNADETTRCRYFVDLVKTGLQIASDYKNIPFEELMDYLTILADNNFIYSWNFKDVNVPEYNLKVRFTCHLSTNDFIMSVSAIDKKSKTVICEGNIIRTMPDNIFFSHISRKIKIKDGNIVISAHWDRELLSINLASLVSGHLVVESCLNPLPDDDAREIHLKTSFKETLEYDNYNFD